MKRNLLILVAVIFFIGIEASFSSQAPELPDFDPWIVQYFERKDFDHDGIYDVAWVILRDNPDFKSSSSLVYLYSFRPVNLERIDLAIWLRFIRTRESGKNTIALIHYLFYARENDKLVLVEERLSFQPQGARAPISEPMFFEENSEFRNRFFEEWRKLGFPDEEIRKNIPKWIWQPEKQ